MHTIRETRPRGPVEWLWRTLMYGVSQPMLLSADRGRLGAVGDMIAGEMLACKGIG
jgi:hypothetical protein